MFGLVTMLLSTLGATGMGSMLKIIGGLVQSFSDEREAKAKRESVGDNEDNLYKLNVLMIGPTNTPYEHGFYFFDIEIPKDYPFSPPKVKYCTQNGKTRFNPNLYVNGKVCLSVLNTWRGEGWTSCQTIRSVLLTLVTVLNEKPLLNEPGIKECHSNFKTYNEAITYVNMSYSIVSVLSGNANITNSIPFMKFAQEHIIKNKEVILEKIDKMVLKHPDRFSIHNNVYNMKTAIDYKVLHQKMTSLIKQLENNEE